MEDRQQYLIQTLRDMGVSYAGTEEGELFREAADELEKLAENAEPYIPTEEEERRMALKNPEQRYWRTDLRLGRNIFALLSNDPEDPSDQDPMIGTMESTGMAEDVVNTHNAALTKYGRRYLTALQTPSS